MRLKEAAGWNQTEEDWRTLLSLGPDSCFGMECDGVLAATTTAVIYGKELAWIGMVLTAPTFRKRGFAHTLMTHTLNHLRERDVAWAKLDATGMGARVYSDFGFQFECTVERWQRGSSDSHPHERNSLGDAPDLIAIKNLDAFNVSRVALLQRLLRAGGGYVGQTGFALWRPGSFAHYFGPCVAIDRSAAEPLLLACLRAANGHPLIWDLAPQNAAAVQLAEKYGFQRARTLSRMECRLRPDAKQLRPDMNLIFALAGFEYG
jgi:GNAT superfamily N-acetyltransferase